MSPSLSKSAAIVDFALFGLIPASEIISPPNVPSPIPGKTVILWEPMPMIS